MLLFLAGVRAVDEVFANAAGGPNARSLPILSLLILKANFLIHLALMEGVGMRIMIASVTLLTMITCPASAGEAFIDQLTSKAVANEQEAAGSTKPVLSAAKLATPLQPKAISLAATAGVAATNASLVTQVGTNNFAGVAQKGGANTSSVVQQGNSNQAVVTQRH